MGLPLAWKKGKLYQKSDEHVWIGVLYKVLGDSLVSMEIPTEYLRDLAVMLRPLAQGVGHFPLDEARKIVGKAGRIAQIIPEARPFTGALWGAFSGAWEADKSGKKEAPPHEAAIWRFSMAAKWLLQLIASDGHIFPLRRLVSHKPAVVATINDIVIQFDASPWGAGATLKYKGKLKEYLGLQVENVRGSSPPG